MAKVEENQGEAQGQAILTTVSIQIEIGYGSTVLLYWQDYLI
jgi:hypothetical protein